MIKLRKYYIGEHRYRFFISLIISLSTIYLPVVGLIYWLGENTVPNLIFAMAVAQILSISLVPGIAFYLIKRDKPMFIAVAGGLLGTLFLNIWFLLPGLTINWGYVALHFISVSLMIFVWTIFLQTNLEKSKSFAAGVFLFLFTHHFCGFIKKLIEQDYQMKDIFFFLCGSLLLMLPAYLFGVLLKKNFRIFKIPE